MNSYSVKISYEDREKGREETTANVDATTIVRAIAKATREFIKGLDRKQRFDANKGLQLKASRVTNAETEAPNSSKGTAA